jgi:hypothetical protein
MFDPHRCDLRAKTDIARRDGKRGDSDVAGRTSERSLEAGVTAGALNGSDVGVRERFALDDPDV